MAQRARFPQPGVPALVSRVATALLIAGMLASATGAPASVTVPEIIAPINGSVVPGAVPAGASLPPKITFRGHAAPGSTIDLVEATNGSLGSTTTNGAGVWEYRTTLGGGTYTVHAIATEADGAIGAPSEGITFDVDAVLPIVGIGSPTTNKIFGPGEDVTLAGTANDDRVVYAVRLDYWLANKLVLRRLAECDLCGAATGASWFDAPTLPLPGYYHVQAQAFDAADNRSALGTIGMFVTGTQAVRAPVPPTPIPPKIETPDTGGIVPGGPGTPITIGGTAPPRSIVTVIDPGHGGRTVGTTRTVGTGATGYWTITTILEQGDYGLRARYRDPSGRTAVGGLVRFYVDGTKPNLEISSERELPVYTTTDPVVIDGRTTDDRRVFAVTLEYWLANKLVLRENADCPQCAVTDSAVWSHTPNLPYPGYYHVRVIAIDQAGHHSPTQVVTFTAATT